MKKKPIEMGKKYRTRDGREVRVLCTDANHKIYPIVALMERDGVDVVNRYTLCGQYSAGAESHLDLIEVSPFEDFKIDDPVMVRHRDDGIWHRRHFAGIDEHGRALVWSYGATSWSHDHVDVKAPWSQFRKPTAQELAGKA